MADTKLKPGFTPIPNDILEALNLIRIRGRAGQVLGVIIRKTFGFRKQEDRIALSIFVEATGLLKPNIVAELNMLDGMNIINRRSTPEGTVYSVNENVGSWKALPKKVTLPKMVIDVTQNGNKPLPIMVHTKETKEKRNIPFQQIIEDLNRRTGKDLKHTAKPTRKLISDRWEEGYRLPDFFRVNEVKCDEWLRTDWSKYLVPSTLYAQAKFEKYLNQKSTITKIDRSKVY